MLISALSNLGGISTTTFNSLSIKTSGIRKCKAGTSVVTLAANTTAVGFISDAQVRSYVDVANNENVNQHSACFISNGDSAFSGHLETCAYDKGYWKACIPSSDKGTVNRSVRINWFLVSF